LNSLRRVAVVAASVLLTAPVAAACGSSSSSGSKSPGGPVSSAAFDAVGYTAPPAGPKPTAGKKVMVISCGQSLSSCADPANAQVEAANLLGWNVTLVDSASDFGKAQSLIRQAVATGYNGILTYALDCPNVTEALREASAAGVKVTSSSSIQCSPGGYDSVVSYAQGDFPTFYKATGQRQVEAALANIGGIGKVLLVQETDLPGMVPPQEGAQEAAKACSGCTTVGTVKFTYGDVGAALQQKIQQALISHPDTTLIVSPYDSIALDSIVPALRSAGKMKSVAISTNVGEAAVMDLFRTGVKGGGAAIPQRWEGYASVDALNRAFAGAPFVSSGIGLQGYDPAHNMPASGGFVPPVDFVAGYKKVWGVG
jgi:ribose transport system substrate-binding protein